MKDTKGFSLVELLAVMVIIGILGTIGIVSIINLRKNQEQKYNNHQNQAFLQAGKNYFTDSKKLLPTIPYTHEEVTLKELQEKNYIEDSFVDFNKKNYKSSSKVVVTKNCDGTYGYYAKLVFSDDIEDIDKINDSYTKEIEIDANSNNVKKLNKIYYTNKNFKFNIKLSSNGGVSSYKYTIYKDDKIFFDSEYYCLGSRNIYNTSINLNTLNYTDGKYKIVVIMYDADGKNYTKSSEEVIIDTKPPKCNLVYTGTLGENNWYNKQGDVVLSYEDENKTGLEYGLTTGVESYNNISSVEQKDTKGITWNGYVKDAAGNNSSCNISFKVDTKKPIISTFNVTSRNSNYNTLMGDINVNLIDDNNVRYDVGLSEPQTRNYNVMQYDKTVTRISNYQISSSYDGGEKTIYIKVKDEAGNISTKTYKYTVYKQCSSLNKTEISRTECSEKCGLTGSQMVTYSTVDKNLNIACPNSESYFACSSGTSTKIEYGACSNACGGTQSTTEVVKSTSYPDHVCKSEAGPNLDCGGKKDAKNIRLYNWNFYDKNCDKKNNNRRYTISIYDCTCIISTDNSTDCGTSYKDGAHYTSYATIYYRNGNAGTEACNGGSAAHPLNSRINSVCNWMTKDNTPLSDLNSDDSVKNYHGYRWFYGDPPAGEYRSFSPDYWLHDIGRYDTRVSKADYPDVTSACVATCKLMF